MASSASPTYSQNVVGYNNVNLTDVGASYLIAVPFTMGASNGVNEVFPLGTLPDYTVINVWSESGQAYLTVQSDTSSPSGWDDATFAPITTLPTLPVGAGFFIVPSGAVPVTFSGAVVINVGTSTNMVFTDVGASYLVSAQVPYSGSVANGSNTGGGANMNGWPDYTVLNQWSESGQAYITSQTDTSSPSGWDDATFAPLGAAPTINVGDGYFVVPSGAFTWTVGL